MVHVIDLELHNPSSSFHSESMSMEQYISQLTPLLDEVVIALVRDRPSAPIKFLVD